jgi:hypothetical protein
MTLVVEVALAATVNQIIYWFRQQQRYTSLSGQGLLAAVPKVVIAVLRELALFLLFLALEAELEEGLQAVRGQVALEEAEEEDLRVLLEHLGKVLLEKLGLTLYLELVVELER